ncbi:homoserine/homoserine lactone efflux protein [Pseudodesulfovibrio tunisiensis]|uniref:homoserine/homoserine lactone efflux protein n=1 Tax=Pseudodesulfovibrio tunisiensis TaxID=463192 RepID=UPI001FB38967|nr:homoserine/homoserine lactone efflux protein [Pseudodesulfovibrio tunisiensis]
MTFATWSTFVAACIVFSLAPGAGSVSTMSCSLSHGFRRTLFNTLGLQISLSIHIMLVAAGLGALVASSAWAFAALKYVGAAYLAWIGIQKWREASAIDLAHDQCTRISGLALVRNGMLVNISNPKSIIFLAAFLPQFVNPALPQIPQYALLGATTLIIDALVMVGFSLLARSARAWFATPGRVRTQNRVFGTLFVGAGLALASAQRSA